MVDVGGKEKGAGMRRKARNLKVNFEIEMLFWDILSFNFNVKLGIVVK